MATIQKTRLSVDKGQTCKITFRLKDGDGQVLDLTGYEAILQARTKADATGTLVLNLQTTDLDEAFCLDSLNGEIHLNFTWEQTKAYPVGNYPYELELISPADERMVILAGTLVIKEGVIQ